MNKHHDDLHRDFDNTTCSCCGNSVEPCDTHAYQGQNLCPLCFANEAIPNGPSRFDICRDCQCIIEIEHLRPHQGQNLCPRCYADQVPTEIPVDLDTDEPRNRVETLDDQDDQDDNT